jgi:hypothetical protein
LERQIVPETILYGFGSAGVAIFPDVLAFVVWWLVDRGNPQRGIAVSESKKKG